MRSVVSLAQASAGEASAGEASADGMASSMPTSTALKDVARFYLKRLPVEQRKQLREAVRLATAENHPLRVGTACSGTDSPVAVFAALAKAMPKLKRPPGSAVLPYWSTNLRF